MKSLQLRTNWDRPLIVRRTGLPFYDAARVIGVAQLFFGTSEAEVIDKGFGWAITGVADLTEPNLSRLWITERLTSGFGPRQLDYKEIQNWSKSQAGTEEAQQQEIRRKWGALLSYFQHPFRPSHTEKYQKVYMQMEAALGQGVRGTDPSAYTDFAAQCGIVAQEPLQETLVARVGLSHAARVEDSLSTRYVLPIFGDPSANSSNAPYIIATGRYWNFDKDFKHAGGDQVAATWAMLTMLESLFDARLPVRNFAYNRADRGFYHSGTLGAEELCRRWYRGVNAVFQDTGQFLQATQREKGGHCADLSRAVSEFCLTFSETAFERVIRLKVRSMADDDRRARLLFQEPETLKEIIREMEIPNVPTSLCRMVAQALTLPKKDDPKTETPPKEWIGRYLRLENARDVRRFYAEIERLLARSPLAKGERMYESLSYPMEQGDVSITQQMNMLEKQQAFRAWRAAFLLKVLQSMARQRKSSLSDEQTREESETEDYAGPDEIDQSEEEE